MSNKIVSILIELSDDLSHNYLQILRSKHKPSFSKDYKSILCIVITDEYYMEIQDKDHLEKNYDNPLELYKGIIFDNDKIIASNIFYKKNSSYTMMDILYHKNYNKEIIINSIINGIINYIQEDQTIYYYLNLTSIDYNYIIYLINIGFQIKKLTLKRKNINTSSYIFFTPNMIKLYYKVSKTSIRCNVIDKKYMINKLNNILISYRNFLQIIDKIDTNYMYRNPYTDPTYEIIISLSNYIKNNNLQNNISLPSKLKFGNIDELFYLRYSENDRANMIDYMDIGIKDDNLLYLHLVDYKSKIRLRYNSYINGKEGNIECNNISDIFYDSLVTMKCLFDIVLSFSGIYIINIVKVDNSSIREYIIIMLSMYMKFLNEILKKEGIELKDILRKKFNDIICKSNDIDKIQNLLSINLSNLIYEYDNQRNYLKIFCDIYFSKNNKEQYYNFYRELTKVLLIKINFFTWEYLYSNSIIELNIPEYLILGI